MFASSLCVSMKIHLWYSQWQWKYIVYLCGISDFPFLRLFSGTIQIVIHSMTFAKSEFKQAIAALCSLSYRSYSDKQGSSWRSRIKHNPKWKGDCNLAGLLSFGKTEWNGEKLNQWYMMWKNVILREWEVPKMCTKRNIYGNGTTKKFDTSGNDNFNDCSNSLF